MNMLENKLRQTIANVPDFPKPGILYRDITPVLADVELRREIAQAFADRYCDAGISAVVGIEARGFIFGVSLADALDVAFIPVRKPGKLPRDVYRQTYELEYGTDTLEMHKDALTPSDIVVVVDDLLATGGSAAAACKLVARIGAEVHECAFVIELGDLKGREMIPAPTFSLVQY